VEKNTLAPTDSQGKNNRGKPVVDSLGPISIGAPIDLVIESLTKSSRSAETLSATFEANRAAWLELTAALNKWTAEIERANRPEMFEITGFTKDNGLLTKKIGLSDDGRIRSDSSQCLLARGVAWRYLVDSLTAFADFITNNIASNEAIALGVLRPGLPESARVFTKHRHAKLKSAVNVIARTRDFVEYRRGRPALVLLDIDIKAMPEAVRVLIDDLGGVWPALVHVFPDLASSGHVIRASTSSNIRLKETGELITDIGGYHIYVLVRDGADIERFLKTLHEKCWLHSLGWLAVGAAGQLLKRSLVDCMVGPPEHLAFEGSAILDVALTQDPRPAVATEGPALDTAALHSLTVVEKAEVAKLQAIEAQRLTHRCVKARERFIAKKAGSIAERTGCTIEATRRTVERWADGILLSDIPLDFDDDEFAGCTVDDVLANPTRFLHATLADPIEGVRYGRCKAMIMQRADGTAWIHSFAHGRTVYELRYGTGRIEVILQATSDDEVVNVFVKLVVDGDIDDHDRHRLRDAISKRTNIGVRVIDRMIATAIGERAAKRKEEERIRADAERTDPRPRLKVPPTDAPWNPVVDAINEVLGSSTADEPPMVNIEGCMTQVRRRRIVNMHTLTVAGANAEEATATRLPSPEQTLLTVADNPAVAGLIEDHIDYVDGKGRSVHLPMPFVNYYRSNQPNSHALPAVAAVATLPIVLPNATILSGPGLVRDRSIIFRVPDELRSLIPSVAECTPDAVRTAMNFLTDVWLADVATDYRGKCTLITTAMSIIERTELPKRVAYSLTAGQAASGKTTAINMVSVGVLGVLAAAAAWSQSPEERRKSVFACLSGAPPLVVWDNIPNGMSISCPTIEASLTSAQISDRVLGESDWRTVPATTIHCFTGNNIFTKGDLASRDLSIRLNVDRLDPENRPFKHADPIAWTLMNRGAILRALYVVMLGNPRLRDGSNLDSAETRFKEWHHLIGSAVENGAKLCAERDENASAISFKDMFFKIRTGEEQGADRAVLLTMLIATWPKGFSSSELSDFLDDYSSRALPHCVESRKGLFTRDKP
jgi:hypothetical protein